MKLTLWQKASMAIRGYAYSHDALVVPVQSFEGDRYVSFYIIKCPEHGHQISKKRWVTPTLWTLKCPECKHRVRMYGF